MAYIEFMDWKKEFDLVIEPGRTEKNYWFDLWRYRELFYTLAWRDFKVRYKQTVIGVLWSVIRPLLTMLVLVIVFSRIAQLPTEGTAPYAILVFAGLLPWQFFANAINEGTNSMVANEQLITKVYFPRIIIPTSTIINGLIDLLLSLGILFILMLFYQYFPNWRILLLPVIFLPAFLLALGVSLFLTAMNVKYRDFRYVIPFVVQFGLFISPVGFSSSVVPEQWQWLYAFNPMVGIIDGFRWCIIEDFDSEFFHYNITVAIFLSVFLLWAGVRYFRRMEKSFADLI